MFVDVMGAASGFEVEVAFLLSQCQGSVTYKLRKQEERLKEQSLQYCNTVICVFLLEVGYSVIHQIYEF